MKIKISAMVIILIAAMSDHVRVSRFEPCRVRLEQREKNIFYHTGNFKARSVESLPGEGYPVCIMKQHKVFTVIAGTVEISTNNETTCPGEG